VLTFFTTTTASVWQFTVTNSQGEVLPLDGAAFKIFFVNVSNNQKTQGSGTWKITDADNGVFQYRLSSTDLADAYATQSAQPGIAVFDVCNEITIGSDVYDPSPNRIQIRKI